jgi:Zn-dependent alcohol dehydrogenase
MSRPWSAQAPCAGLDEINQSYQNPADGKLIRSVIVHDG